MAKRRYSDFAQRLNVEALLDDLGFEQKYEKDDELVGHCFDPWGLHKNGDTTGKLGVNTEKKVYNCWVCGGGSLLDLVMAVKGVPEEDGIDYLYSFVESNQSDDSFLSDIDRILSEAKREQKALPFFNENVLLQWGPNPALDRYLSSRGISEDTARSRRVSFNDANVRRSSKGDFTGPAVIFPHFWRGRLVGWQARWVCDTPTHIPKYVNTHDFPRESTIYGYEAVYFSEKPIVVVESVPTVLFLQSLGFPAVATFGGTVTDEQIRLLRLCQQGIIVAADNDTVGDKNETKLVSGLERFTTVRICERVPGEGSDLGDLAEYPHIAAGMLEEASYV